MRRWRLSVAKFRLSLPLPRGWRFLSSKKGANQDFNRYSIHSKTRIICRPETPGCPRLAGLAKPSRLLRPGNKPNERHLHFEPGTGLVDVIDPETGQPAQPGEIGSLVLTPFAPYRESVVVLRYDTEDLVRVPDESLTCSLQHFPATSNLLGKKRLSVQTSQGWICPRDILEAVEAVDDIPLPARCGFWGQDDGVAVEVAVPDANAGIRQRIEASLDAHQVPIRALYLVTDPDQLTSPLPWRGDLHESSFAAPARNLAEIWSREFDEQPEYEE